MKKLVLSAIAAAAIAGSAFTLSAIAAEDNAGPPGVEWMMANQSLMLDAKLAGMKAVLKLTPEQEKLWPAFESAVRDGMKMRMDMMKTRMEAMGAMREKMQSGQRPSPIDMMTRMSDHLAKASEAVKKVADAAKPLYDSLNDEQKSHFGPLLRMLHGGAGGMMGRGMMGRGMMGKGMMGGGMMGDDMMDPPAK
jgi:zinc resistance-associated protein